MAELIITVENPEDEALLINLAKRLNAHVRQQSTLPPRSNTDGMIRALNKISESKTFDYIKDPMSWQREMRQDRPLPFSD